MRRSSLVLMLQVISGLGIGCSCNVDRQENQVEVTFREIVAAYCRGDRERWHSLIVDGRLVFEGQRGFIANVLEDPRTSFAEKETAVEVYHVWLESKELLTAWAVSPSADLHAVCMSRRKCPVFGEIGRREL